MNFSVQPIGMAIALRFDGRNHQRTRSSVLASPPVEEDDKSDRLADCERPAVAVRQDPERRRRRQRGVAGRGLDTASWRPATM
jgi:hypothetical protein